MDQLLKSLTSGGSATSKLARVAKNKLLKPTQFPPPTKVAPLAVLSNYYQYPLSKLKPEDIDFLKDELTIEATGTERWGGKATSFNVYHIDKTYIYVPRFYGILQWGWPSAYQLASSAKMNPDVTFAGNLKPVQKEAIPAVMKQLRATGGALLLKDCGMGKTVDGCYIALQLGLRTGVLVYNSDLMEQWQERINEWFPLAKVGLVQKDKQDYKDMDFVIIMVQSLMSRTTESAHLKGTSYDKELFSSIGFLIVDEAHHIGASTFCKAINLFQPQYTLAMTATPTRNDRQAHLISWFMGPIAFQKEREVGDMEVHVFVHRHDGGEQKEIKYKRRNQPAILAKSKMIDNLFKDPVRNLSIVDRLVERVQEGRQILVLSTYHFGIQVISSLLQEKLPDLDIGFFTGKVPPKKRPAELMKQVVFATRMKGDEGIDRPDLDTLFRIDPVSQSKQQVGRILRDLPGKKPIVEHWHDPFSDFNGWFHNCLRYYQKKGYHIHLRSTCPQPVPECMKMDTDTKKDTEDDFYFF